jgi:hypothetical protein
MHPFSILTLGIFVAGYITARWDLVTRLYELAIFAWNHGVVVRVNPHVCLRLRGRSRVLMIDLRPEQTRTTKGFLLLSVFFFLLILPLNHLSTREINLVRKLVDSFVFFFFFFFFPLPHRKQTQKGRLLTMTLSFVFLASTGSASGYICTGGVAAARLLLIESLMGGCQYADK